MPHRVSVQLNPGLYHAAAAEARRQGRSDGRTDGVASLIRGALRAYLNRNGYTVAELDAMESSAVPGSRNGRESQEARL